MGFDSLRHASLFQHAGLLISLAPLAVALSCAIRPDERRLALMRPLSLASVFGSIASLLLGLINSLYASGRAAATNPQLPPLGTLLAEALVHPFVGFACLTAAWLLVAAAFRKTA